MFLLERNTSNVVQLTGYLDCRSRNISRLGKDVTRLNIVIIPKMALFDSSKAVKSSFFAMVDNPYQVVFFHLRTFLVPFLADIMRWEILFQPCTSFLTKCFPCELEPLGTFSCEFGTFVHLTNMEQQYSAGPLENDEVSKPPFRKDH